MSKEQIISKGKYTHPQPDTIVGVKQYLFVRDEDGKKRLLLRFCNNRDEVCSKFVFTVYRLDVKGNVLGEERFECDDREIAGKEVFSFEHRIDVEEKCTDFLVKVGYAKYGNYTHQVENNEVSVAYSEKRDELEKKGKGGEKAKPRKINERAFELSWTFAVISVIILAIAFAATSFLLKNYKDATTDFSLSGVHYTFANEEKTSIIITGCSANYREITLSNELDGYPVVGIAEGAFKSNTNLTKITINGINIDDNTFNGCEKLKAIEINNVTSIGAGAFMSCGGLETVVINGDESGSLLTIGTAAFGSCESLERVEINQLIKYGDKVDYFANSLSIKELVLNNVAYTVADVNMTYVDRIGLLFGITATGENAAKLEKLTVENMDTVPANFVSGFKKLESVTINGENAKAIGNEAFKGCSSLAAVTFKSKPESIGAYAFAGTAITSFDFGKVATMGESAFKDAASLSSVSGFGAGGLDNVPKGTFEGCKALSGITLGENVRTIYSGAFKKSGLTKLSIPAGVTSESGILTGCESLAELEIYELEENGYIGHYFGATTDEMKVGSKAIPATLKTISVGAGSVIYDYAFAGCSGLVNLLLPDGITYIGDYAFYDCKTLSDIKVPEEGLTYVGAYAFARTTIKSLNLSSTVEHIGYGALSNCNSIESLTLPFLGQNATSGGTISHIFGADVTDSIPVALKTITLIPVIPMVELPDYAFANCIGATTISVPSTISVIGEGAYYNCEALTSIDASNITNIKDYAFSGCESLSAIVLGQSLNEIGMFAFENSGIAVLEIPDTVKKIGRGVIKGCDKLISLTIPFMGETPATTNDVNIAYLSGAYGGISDNVPKALNTITVTKQFVGNAIPACAFYNCQSLSTLIIPGGITAIGDSAFYNCKSLTSYDLSGIQSIGTNAFAWSGLTSVSIPKGITAIGDGMFSHCESLKSVNIPDGVRSIGAYTFEATGLEEIVIPGSVTRIGDYAFSASPLKSISLPNGLSRLGESAFAGCDKLESIEFPITSAIVDSENSVCLYLFNGAFPESLKSITVNRCYGNMIYTNAFSAALYVEEIILDAQIHSIGAAAFANCYNLRYVSLPSSLGQVAPSAFSECYHLYEISNDSDCVVTSSYVLEYTTSETRAPLVRVGDFAFARYNREWYLINYKSAESLTLPSGVEYEGKKIPEYKIPAHLFYNDDTIVTFDGSSQSSDIGKRAFYGCDSLKTVKFTNNVNIREIGLYAFSECIALETVALPNSVETIEDQAFYYCFNLKIVEFPVSLKTIGEKAFYQCNNLGTVKLYDKVKTIGAEAFYNCTGLYDVYSICTLPIRAGYNDYGYVARYAVAVHTDMDSKPSVPVDINGIGTFMHGGGEWLLVSGYDVKNLKLDTFTYNGETVSSYRISAYAYESRLSIESIAIGNAVKQIQTGAFYGCSSVKSLDMSKNGSITEIEVGAFEHCSSLRTAVLADSIVKLGNNVFADCTSLESVTMPSQLKEIGIYAFARCERLLSVTIGAYVTSIGDGAFEGCIRLYEVIELSPSITVEIGGTDNGSVARYAKGVFTSEGGGFERLEQRGIKLIYIDGEDTWYLYSFSDKGDKTIEVSNMGGNLVILPYAFENGTFAGIVLPSNLRTIDANAFSSCYALNNVYFAGTKSQWSNINNYDESTFYDVYFKKDCIHDNAKESWAYDANGNVSTKKCELRSEVTTPATCYDIGVMTYYCKCEGCTYTEEDVINKLDHSFRDDVCQNCGYVQVLVDGATAESYVESGKLVIVDFVYDESLGCFVSTNKDHNSVSIFKLTAKELMTVSFKYEASCEAYKDYLVVYVDGVMNGRVSAKSSETISLVLEAGSVLTISYEKNESVSNNNDCGYIKDLVIIESPEQSDND